MNELNVLFPQEITDANYTFSNIAEPDLSVGEAVWVSGDNSALKTRVIRTQTHRVYERIATGVSTTAPEDDAVLWADAGPTNKWAWADKYSDTAIASSVPIVFSATPGTVTAMTFYGLVGDAITVVVKDAPGGAVLFSDAYSLYDYPGVDLYWEYFFYFPLQLDSLVITDIYPEPACEVTVTVGITGTSFECGRANFGNLEPLGLPEYGITAKPRSFRKIKTDDFGNVTVIPGRTAVDLSGSCVLDVDKANAAFELIKRLQNTPVSVIPSSLEKYRHTVNFGFLDADITAEGPSHSKISLKMEGIT
jgi:hypothetical protein